jgi:type VI secretion system protein ImpH
MASTDRQTAHPVAALLKAVQEKPYAFGFFQVLRLFECLYPHKPRFGTSRRPADDPLRLAQEPALTFESASLTSFEPGTDGKPHRLAVRFFGLLGPNGPLPLHLTEYALQRLRYRQGSHHDRTFAWFLDIFHHRMLSLFYRAWANNEPTVSFDRPESDRFAAYIGSLAGLGMPSLRARDEIADLTKLYYCGWLSSQTKPADGLQAMLADYFKVKVCIEEFVGEWMTLSEEHLCRMGTYHAYGRLGQTAIMGPRVWGCQHKFRIILGPMSYPDYQSFLPGGDNIRHLAALVRNYVGDELAWDLNLILDRDEDQTTRLNGRSHLGWTSWLDRKPGTSDADDLTLAASTYVNPSQLGIRQ